MKNFQVAAVCNETAQKSKTSLWDTLSVVIPWLGQHWSMTTEPDAADFLFLIMDDTPAGHRLWREYRARFPVDRIILCGAAGLPSESRWNFDWKPGEKPSALRLFNTLCHLAESHVKFIPNAEPFNLDEYIQGIIQDSSQDGISRICTAPNGAELCILASEQTCYALHGMDGLIPLLLAKRDSIIVTQVSDDELMKKIKFSDFSSRLLKYTALGNDLNFLQSSDTKKNKPYQIEEILWLATLVNSHGRELETHPFNDLNRVSCWPEYAALPFYQDYLPFRHALRAFSPSFREIAKFTSATERQIVDAHNACAILGLVELYEAELTEAVAPQEYPAEQSGGFTSEVLGQAAESGQKELLPVETRVFERDELDLLEPMDTALFERLKAELLGQIEPAKNEPKQALTIPPDANPYQLAQDKIYRALKPASLSFPGKMTLVIGGPDGADKATAMNTLKECAITDLDGHSIPADSSQPAAPAFKLDYAELNFKDLVLHVYGVPSHRNFDILGNVLCKKAWGMLLLINHEDNDPAGNMKHYFGCYHSPSSSLRLAVGIAHYGQPSERSLEECLDYLSEIETDIPIHRIDLRDPMDFANILAAMAGFDEPPVGMTDLSPAPAEKPDHSPTSPASMIRQGCSMLGVPFVLRYRSMNGTPNDSGHSPFDTSGRTARIGALNSPA